MSKIAPHAAGKAGEAPLKHQLLFRSVNPLLATGYTRPLEMRDLPGLPPSLTSMHSLQALWRQSHAAGTPSSAEDPDVSWLETPDAQLGIAALWSLMGVLWRAHGSAFMALGLLKALQLSASFAGPLLLSLTVSHLQDSASRENLPRGLLLVGGLGGSFVLSAVLNTGFNMRAALLQVHAHTIRFTLVHTCTYIYIHRKSRH